MPIDSHEDQRHPSSPFLYCHRLETSIFDIWDDRARWYMGHRPYLDRVLLGKCREEKFVSTEEPDVPNKSFYYTDLENSTVETANSMGEGKNCKSWLYSIPRTRLVFWITVVVLWMPSASYHTSRIDLPHRPHGSPYNGLAFRTTMAFDIGEASAYPSKDRCSERFTPSLVVKVDTIFWGP